ncbi:MAG TPA: GntR family transcriptional regulator [Solirubrobacteraceae bacterium]
MSNEGASQTLGAALRLRELILGGEFRGGDRVSEQPLSARLGVSRTPLRLAFAQLEHEGLLEQIPGGGFVISSFTIEQVVDAIDVRGLLEGAAARLAAERGANTRELEAMHGCVSQLDRLFHPSRLTIDAFERYVELNERFHSLLINLAGSDALEAAYARVMALPFASPSAFVILQAELPESQRSLYVAQLQHRSVLEAIENREGSRAEALGREHARIARRNLNLVLSNERALAVLPGASLIRLADGDEDVA